MVIRTLGELLATRVRGAVRPYQPEPLHAGMFGHFNISGEALVEASKNYNEATLSWMMGVGVFGQIRLDLKDHRLRLVDADWGGTVANRAKRHRRENIYRVAIALHVNGAKPVAEPTVRYETESTGPSGDAGARVVGWEGWTHEMLMPMLASDFDRAWRESGEGEKPGVGVGKSWLMPGITDAHGRKL